MAGLTKKKAKTILEEGMVRGKPLTKKQKGFFGLVAGGQKKKIRKKTLLT